MEIIVFNEQKTLIDFLTDLAVKKQFVFRGYNIQEQLYPNIIRNKLSDVENKLLFEFERYGAQYISANSPIDLMSYAQHFGLSTRLLDFTYNPFVALYFSLFTPKSHGKYTFPDDKEYYYIRYSFIEKNILIKHIPYFNKGNFFETDSLAQRCIALINTINMMFNGFDDKKAIIKDKDTMISNFFKSIATNTVIDKDINKFVNENKSKVDSNTLLFIDSNQSNQRLVMQQGLFMFPYTLDKDRHLSIIDKNTNLIKIHKSLRENLLSYLDTLGINAFKIMPDLSSVCEAVERKIKDERTAKSQLFKKKVK